MESIGDKLRLEREQKGLSIEQIARDTNIAKRYLEALEMENFTVFPGDPYLIGFLRNYAEYLGIDPVEMVALYRNFTIQSQPVPIDELLQRNRPAWRLLLFIIPLVALLGVGGYYLFGVLLPRGVANRPAPAGIPTREPATFTLDTFLERRFIVSDVVIVPIGDEEHRITVRTIDESLTVGVPGGTSVLRIGDERSTDLDGDSTMDIRIALTDIDSDADPKTAFVRIDRTSASRADLGFAAEPDPQATAEDDDVPFDNVGTPAIGSREVAPVEIRREESPSAFRLVLSFRGNVLLRHVVDAGERIERYFQSGESIELDIARVLQLWISNAGSVIARIDGTEVRLGRNGEVSTRSISWQLLDSGGYALRMVAMY